jgi:hypothetical protein
VCHCIAGSTSRTRHTRILTEHRTPVCQPDVAPRVVSLPLEALVRQAGRRDGSKELPTACIGSRSRPTTSPPCSATAPGQGAAEQLKFNR